MFKSRLIAIVIAITVLSGCVSFQIGQNFDLSTFETQVKHGVTTQNQVQQWLGNPASSGIVVNTEGERMTRWTYYYSQGRFTRMQEASIKTLEIQFDSNGIVKAFDWTSNQ